jgi:hypothetical protein
MSLHSLAEKYKFQIICGLVVFAMSALEEVELELALEKM